MVTVHIMVNFPEILRQAVPHPRLRHRLLRSGIPRRLHFLADKVGESTLLCDVYCIAY